MIGLLRFVFKTAVVLILLVAAGYYPLVLHSPQPEPPGYELDMNAVRQAAASLEGPKVQDIRVEQVAEFSFAEAMVMAGEDWQSTPIPIYSYKLVFPERSIVVDTAMSGVKGVPGFMVNSFDEGAYQRMLQAMDNADRIVITHEHFDHIGGIVDHPRVADLLPHIQLTEEQFAHPDRMLPLHYPEAVFDDYEPLRYDTLHALAPGVVLIKAPGHTPGSQMVYIQQADGREVLLLGDVSWQMRNIHAVRERPLFITAIVRENRAQVINQFQALNALQRREPDLAMVPGHDAATMKTMLARGVITAGF